MRRTLIAWAAGWLCCLAALVGLLAIPAPLIPQPTPVLEAPREAGGELEPLTCTRQVATVDHEGDTHLETIDCKEENQ